MGFYDTQVQGQLLHPETSAAGTRTVTVRDFDALQPHLEAWDRLAWDAPQRLAALLPAWADAGFRYGPEPGEHWLCTFAYEGNRLIGVLPLISGAHPILGSKWPVLRTCDRHVLVEKVVLAPDRAAIALQALLASVRQQVPNHLGVDLMALRRGSPVLEALKQGIDGYIMHQGSRAHNSVLDVRGDFETYLSNLKNMRSNLNRYRRKLEKRGNVSVEILRGPSASEEFLDEFLHLEASGWKGRGGTAILQNENSHAYHKTLIKNLAARGCLEWYLMRVDGRLVAARFAVRCGSALMLPKVAFDEDYAECRPGMLVTGEVLKEAFARPEIEEINPLSNAEAHRYWHMVKDEYTTIHLVRNAAIPTLFQLSRVAMRSFYREQVRPRIPDAVKDVQHRFQRRGDLKPRRAAESRSARTGEAGHDDSQ
jgi:CelD/BcsL family acetyltransferase involved in cellulose biosynthesis